MTTSDGSRRRGSESYGFTQPLAEEDTQPNAVIQQFPDPLVLCSPQREGEQVTDLVVTTANAAAGRLFQCDPSDLVGRGLLELFPSATSLGAFDFLVSSLRGGQPAVLRLPQVTIGDSLFSFDLSTAIVGQEILVVVRDVSAAVILDQRRQAVLEAMIDPHVFLQAVRDDQGVIVDFVYAEANRAACDYLGMSVEDLVDSRLLDLLPGQAGSGMLAMYAQAVESGQPLSLDDYRYPNEILQDERRYDIRAVRVGDGLSFTWRDVTDRHREAEALADSEELFRTVMRNSAVGLCLVAVDGTFVQVNDALCDMFARAREELLVATWQELTHPDDLEGDQAFVNAILSGDRDSYRLQKRYLKGDGEVVWGDLSVSCTRDPAGAVILLIAQITDITAQRKALADLRASEEKFRLLAENSTDAVLHLRGDTMDWLSPSLETVLGWAPEAWVGARLDEFTHPDDLDSLRQYRDDINAGQTKITRMRLLDSSGAYRWVELHSSPFEGSEGLPDGIVASFRTIDQQMKAERILRDRARLDHLTGLLNRSEVFQQLEELLTQQPRTGMQTAVAFCDIDNFKDINDTHGHHMGDHVLRTLADEIRTVVREQDLVARIGGDELLLVLPGVHDLESAAHVVEKVLQHVGTEHRFEGVAYTPKLSVGVALAQPGESPNDVIVRADAAMYSAKETGGNRVVTSE